MCDRIRFFLYSLRRNGWCKRAQYCTDIAHVRQICALYGILMCCFGVRAIHAFIFFQWMVPRAPIFRKKFLLSRRYEFWEHFGFQY